MSDEVWLVFGFKDGKVVEFMGTASECDDVDEDLGNDTDHDAWTKMLEDDIELPDNMLHGGFYRGRVFAVLTEDKEPRPVVGFIERYTKRNEDK